VPPIGERIALDRTLTQFPCTEDRLLCCLACGLLGLLLVIKQARIGKATDFFNPVSQLTIEA